LSPHLGCVFCAIFQSSVVFFASACLTNWGSSITPCVTQFVDCPLAL
jgi:hypothetical protein